MATYSVLLAAVASLADPVIFASAALPSALLPRLVNAVVSFFLSCSSRLSLILRAKPGMRAVSVRTRNAPGAFWFRVFRVYAASRIAAGR